MARTRATLRERIQRAVVIDDNGCWIWQRYINVQGYGEMKVTPRQNRMAHRASYEAFIGPIPDGMQMDHLCRVRACVNPNHLEPVTPAINTARADLAPATVNAAKTACDHGHPFDGTNTYVNQGKRYCRTCNARNAREYRLRLAGATTTTQKAG